MDIFRYSRNAYGQEVLEGISWDLLWVFAGFSAAVIVAHLLYTSLSKMAKP